MAWNILLINSGILEVIVSFSLYSKNIYNTVCARLNSQALSTNIYKWIMWIGEVEGIFDSDRNLLWTKNCSSETCCANLRTCKISYTVFYDSKNILLLILYVLKSSQEGIYLNYSSNKTKVHHSSIPLRISFYVFTYDFNIDVTLAKNCLLLQIANSIHLFH